MSSVSLGAPELVEVVRAFRDALAAHRAHINLLNVYPVPDGDTGTNMTLTIESVCTELEGTDATRLGEVCAAIAHGSLMGARGNSGVILSQILRGLSAELANADAATGIDPPTLAAALVAAADQAYQAVMHPVEGTILTVVRKAAAAGDWAASAGADLVAMLDATREAADKALASTPALLPVLAEAGVVDAGGTGLLLLFDAFLSVLDGREIPEASHVDSPEVAAHDHAALSSHAGDVSELRYEVMFFLDAPDDTIEGFKDAWAALGDSIVVVGGEGVWNCHIHTDDVGGSIEAGIEVGRPHTIRVTDLLEELEESSWVAEQLADAERLEPVNCAVVAVSVGDGVEDIFGSLGVQVVIAGGQTMNPSTAQLLDAVERVPADQVVIVPNNKNIIPVAEQLASQTDKSVAVVGTTSVAEGFAALLSYGPEGDANAASMITAAEAVDTGEVTRAVRDSAWCGGEIATGDWIGLGPSGIDAATDTALGASIDLLETLVTDEHELVTIIVGSDGTEPEASAMTEWLAEHRPDVEVEVHDGGQPLYPYCFGIE